MKAADKATLPFAKEIINCLSNEWKTQFQIEDELGIDADDEESQDAIGKTLNLFVSPPIVCDMEFRGSKILYKKL